MKLAKKILVSAISGVVAFNCYSAVNAVRTKKQGVSLTVTHPSSTERNIVIVDASTLIDQFKRVLDVAEETISCIQSDCVHCAEYRQIPRREIHRVFTQIYKNIFEPVLEFSFENYGSRTRGLNRKDFTPSFLIYSDETGHRCDIERFHDFSLNIKRKMRKNGRICKAIDEYRKDFPELLDDAQKILDDAIENMKELCSVSQRLSADDFALPSDSDESSEYDLFNFFDEAQAEPTPSYAPAPSPQPESGNCFTRFFRTIFSR